MTNESPPFVSVIVPVRNEEPFIEATVRSVLSQDYPADRFEVIVVDGLSDDGTAAVVARMAEADSRLSLVSNPWRLSSAARNIGLDRARGEIILFIDGHVHIESNRLLRDTARLMDEQAVDVLSRPQFLETPDNTPLQNAIAVARRSWLGHGLDSTIYLEREAYVAPASSAAAYRRRVFDRVGRFDESFDASEDYEFNYRVGRMGYRSFSSPKLAIRYYPRSSLGGLFRQMRRYGLGRFRLARKHPATVTPASLVPVAITISAALLLPALAGVTVLAPVIWMWAAYAVLVFAVSLTLAIRRGARHFLRLMAIFPVIHLGLGTGYFSGLFQAMAKPARDDRPAGPAD